MAFGLGTKDFARLIGTTLLLLLVGCVAPNYDSKIDDLLGGLQTDVDTHIVKLISLDHKIASLRGKTDADSVKAAEDAKKKAGFDANGEFYDKADVALTGLSLRFEAQSDASREKALTALRLLHDNILEQEGSLQKIHEHDGIVPEFVLREKRKQLNAQFGALLAYQLARKSGQPK